jgi:hypothetical protein
MGISPMGGGGPMGLGLMIQVKREKGDVARERERERKRETGITERVFVVGKEKQELQREWVRCGPATGTRLQDSFGWAPKPFHTQTHIQIYKTLE